MFDRVPRYGVEGFGSEERDPDQVARRRRRDLKDAGAIVYQKGGSERERVCWSMARTETEGMGVFAKGGRMKNSA